jgi:hypothetical protein
MNDFVWTANERFMGAFAVTAYAEQETLQRMSDELDEVIAVFAETYAQVAELQRVLGGPKATPPGS